MKPFINFTFPSGQVYQVPTDVIARDRAENYKDEFGGDVERSLEEDTKPLFAEDYNVADWAENNMSWDDLAPHARLIDFEAKQLKEQFGEASTHCVEAAQLPPQLHGDTILLQPIEMILSVMAADGAGTSAITVSGEGGNKVAFITVRGPESVVDAYMQMLTNFTNYLAEQSQLAQAAESGALAPSTNTPN